MLKTKIAHNKQKDIIAMWYLVATRDDVLQASKSLINLSSSYLNINMKNVANLQSRSYDYSSLK